MLDFLSAASVFMQMFRAETQKVKKKKKVLTFQMYTCRPHESQSQDGCSCVHVHEVKEKQPWQKCSDGSNRFCPAVPIWERIHIRTWEKVLIVQKNNLRKTPSDTDTGKITGSRTYVLWLNNNLNSLYLGYSDLKSIFCQCNFLKAKKTQNNKKKPKTASSGNQPFMTSPEHIFFVHMIWLNEFDLNF